MLPVTARDEEWQATTQESMFNYVRLSEGGIDRLDNVRPEVDILRSIGEKLIAKDRFDFSRFHDHENIRNTISSTIPGMKKLASIDNGKHEFYIDKRIKHQPEFQMPDGRARFICTPLSSSVSSNGEYGFTLMTVRSEGQFNSIIYEETDSYRRTPHRWSVLMNKDDMAKLALASEDKINLYSDTGKMEGLSVFSFDVPAGSIMAYYPEANVLIGRELDPVSKTPAFKSVAVRLEKSP